MSARKLTSAERHALRAASETGWISIVMRSHYRVDGGACSQLVADRLLRYEGSTLLITDAGVMALASGEVRA